MEAPGAEKQINSDEPKEQLGHQLPTVLLARLPRPLAVLVPLPLLLAHWPNAQQEHPQLLRPPVVQRGLLPTYLVLTRLPVTAWQLEEPV